MNHDVAAEHSREVAGGGRFEFGKNWARFLAQVGEDRIRRAEQSLSLMLERESLSGLSFLDIGSGSGLFSLAARRLGAEVHSFDFDTNSVACTRELRRRYFPEDIHWKVEQASVLDRSYLDSLPGFDIVYSWGVLHHTGQMWTALDNAQRLVRPGGQLFIAIYNDQGTPSRRWRKVKKLYNALPAPLRVIVTWPCFLHLWWRPIVKDLLRGRPGRSFRDYTGLRGMSVWTDLIDWVGGYPFEVARPEQILDFYRQRGFILTKMTTEGGSLGCNEFVFRRC
jgi:2-polyprenyl-6-hydroxyphenyl methylase/3-demethylubiquinone-9 3-methyltransferase